jgi:hypothetical protein
MATVLPAVILSPPASHAIRLLVNSASRVASGLSAQPLSTVCSTWLSINPGIPSVALTLPQLNPLLCV